MSESDHSNRMGPEEELAKWAVLFDMLKNKYGADRSEIGELQEGLDA